MNATPGEAVAAPTGPDVARHRASFREAKQRLIADFLATRPSMPAAAHLTQQLVRVVDRTLQGLWAEAGMPPEAALLAVGGYGRADLMPYSDVDLLVLLPEPGGDPAVPTARIEAFVTACWDVGLEPGVAVRTVSESVAEAQRDVTVRTSLLEARRIAGDAHAVDVFEMAMAQALDPLEFLHAKLAEMRLRHAKHDETPYALEPNVKESPGGLRDLQTIIWVARAAGLGRTWQELAANGLITPFEVRQLHRHHGTLELIRARLHAVAGRREDRLVFDLQTAVAQSFGLRASPRALPSEQLMHRYYWAAKAVTQLRQIVLQNLAERIEGGGKTPMRRIDAHFLDRGGALEVARDDLYLEQPHTILETFLVYARHPALKSLSPRTLRALYNARHVMDASFRRDPRNRRTFLEILRQPQGITHAFRLMNQTSVLGRYLWVFRRIVGRMQHDLFHAYTVDQHILMVLRNMRRFFIPEHGHEYPFLSQLASGFDKPELLYIAALFHDVAKGRGGDHSQLGGLEVRRFARDHGLDAADSATVDFLVREHLTMSHVAQKEDLSDPKVIERFAAVVGDARRLDALYLLTVADIRGTSPKVWNAWKGKLLEDLYRATLRTLGGAVPSLDAEIETRKQEARQALALVSARPGTQAPLWATLEPSYFARHDAGDIAWHARMLWRHLTSEHAVVHARPSQIGAGLQVLVYSRDRPDLFLRICAELDRAGYSIQDAKVHTSRTGYALDTFQLTHPHAEADGDAEPHARISAYRDMVPLLEHRLTHALAGTQPLPEPQRGRVSRRVRSFPVRPYVAMRPDEHARRWLLTISTADRAGLLVGVARVLARHGINLQLAKITTLGERAEDTFLIDGAGLGDGKLQWQLERELLEAIA